MSANVTEKVYTGTTPWLETRAQKNSSSSSVKSGAQNDEKDAKLSRRWANQFWLGYHPHLSPTPLKLPQPLITLYIPVMITI